MVKRKILFISDDPDEFKLLELVFSKEDFEVLTVGDNKLDFNVVVQEKPDLIIINEWTLGKDSYEILKRAKEQQISTRVILCAIRYPFSQDIRSFIEVGVCDYITRPYEIQILIEAAKEALARDDTLLTCQPAPMVKRLLNQYELLEWRYKELRERERGRNREDYS